MEKFYFFAGGVISYVVMNRKAIKLTRKSLFSCRIQKGRHCHRSHRQPHSGETWHKMRGRSRWWQSYSYTVHNGKTLCLVYERKNDHFKDGGVLRKMAIRTYEQYST